jgi:predicted 2-oxoglutarate/Fe(II)-dependent dioxygenase YbiX
VAGRYIVLAFLGSGSDPRSEALLRAVLARRELFDDAGATFFGVSCDPHDLRRPGMADAIPGIRFFWDFDRAITTLYGLEERKLPFVYVLDPTLRVLAALDEPHALIPLMETLPPPRPRAVAAEQAPVLVVPRVFEPSLCARLVEYYDRVGGQDLGFAQDIEGKTRRVVDHGHKRRGDRELEDPVLRDECARRIRSRLLPMVRRAYQVRITRMERYLVSCYDVGGHFAAHRDNTTKGTAHRQFAVSLFLNTGEYDGGFLQFPEYGNALYSAPAGGAVVFSCSLLHVATPVLAGRRLMFLPFLYDDAQARVREENEQHLDVATALYR